MLTFAQRDIGLRGRMVILLGIAAALLATDRTREIVQRRTDSVTAARDHLVEIARTGADRQDDVLSAARVLLTLAAEMPEAASRSATDCTQPFSRAVQSIPWLKSLASFEADGRIICSNSPTGRTMNIADRPYFQRAIATRGFVVSDLLQARSDGKLGIGSALPRTVDGRVDTVVVALVNVDWLGTLANRLGDGSRTSVILTDSKGTVVAASPTYGSIVGRPIATVGIPEKDVADREWLVDVTGPDGIDRIYAGARLPQSGGRLFVGAERDAFLGPVYRESLVAFAKLGLALLIALGTLWFALERLVLRPTRSLAALSARLGGGDLDARAEDGGGPTEFAALGRAFNAMAARLEERDASLRAVNEHLNQLATVDPLTGIANRRLFDERLAQEWRRSARSGRPLGLVMLDVDWFKAFNDTYGHPAGDACLARIARAAATGLRPEDLVARMGGEEFAILLPGADVHRALHTARLLRLEVESLAIPHSASPGGFVTVSAGVAIAQPRAGLAAGDLLREADEALYRAKQTGRNRVAGPGSAPALAS